MALIVNSPNGINLWCSNNATIIDNKSRSFLCLIINIWRTTKIMLGGWKYVALEDDNGWINWEICWRGMMTCSKKTRVTQVYRFLGCVWSLGLKTLLISQLSIKHRVNVKRLGRLISNPLCREQSVKTTQTAKRDYSSETKYPRSK